MTIARIPLLAAAASLASLAACGAKAPAPQIEPAADARIAAADRPVAHGDCVEARRRVDTDPATVVDAVPSPVAMKPAPFLKAPARAFNKDGSAVIRAEVIVDTLGRAEMATFRAIEISNPWFEQNLKSVLPRWRFTPAQYAGCAVRRAYRFSATVPARAAKAPAKTPAKAPARSTRRP